MGLVISYPIFFNSGRKSTDIYRDGLIRNAKKYKDIFPKAKMVVYHDNSVDDILLTTLKECGVTLKERPSNNNWSGTFWRFEELDNMVNYERFLRDFVWSQAKERALINIEKRSFESLKNIVNSRPHIVPKWMLEDNYLERIFTKWSAK